MKFANVIFGPVIGVSAVIHALAADLSTRRAAPADYAKVCNVGGMAGFLLPGSETCFKISGYIAGQIAAGYRRAGYFWTPAPAAASMGPTGGNLRDWLDSNVQTDVSFDVRQATAYGVLRGYADVRFDNGASFDNAGGGAHVGRAFAQWGGFTVGKANSFFTFYNR